MRFFYQSISKMNFEYRIVIWMVAVFALCAFRCAGAENFKGLTGQSDLLASQPIPPKNYQNTQLHLKDWTNYNNFIFGDYVSKRLPLF